MPTEDEKKKYRSRFAEELPVRKAITVKPKKKPKEKPADK